MPIRILSSDVASQIAAGEVVERPASVVKELLENALDAGASSVTVTVKESGRTLIEVADDGVGIASSELPLAIARHATSKLQSASDLFRIATLGFRGEALASIGSVSRLSLISRAQTEESGTQIKVEGGLEGKPQLIGAPQGTVVRVEDLFYNVPARLKFLKQDATERRAIDTLLSRYALAYSNVRFKFVSDSSSVLQTAGDGDQRAILASLYGVDVAKQMLEVLAEDDGLRLTGFTSPASLTRSNRKEITFFVNGRWVQDVALSTALLQAYHTLLMVGRFPLSILFLEINPEEVDVNVHPAKAEVRFRSSDRVFSFIQRSIRRALLAYSPVPQLPPQMLWGAGASHFSDPPVGSSSSGLDWQMAADSDAAISQPPIHSPEQVMIDGVPLMRLVGQIGAAYLVAEGPDGLYLIDQHAAHERVLFEKLLAQRGRKNIPSQALLSPATVQLTPAQAGLLENQLEILQNFGFDVQAFGPGAFQVRAMPTLFSGADPAAALRALVEDFEEDEAPLQTELEAKIAGRVCKRLAVKAGQALSVEEQRALLTNLEACESPRTCPHGRPTMIHLSVDMLERQFGRRGAR